jgi:hypothetical protein
VEGKCNLFETMVLGRIVGLKEAEVKGKESIAF